MSSYREFKKEAILTKRYFMEIADILAKHNASDEMIQEFADYFVRQNPRFDYGLFMKYINSKQGKVPEETPEEVVEV